MSLSLGRKIHHVTSSLLQKEPWRKLEIFILFHRNILYVQNGVSKVSLRDVTEGHIWPESLKLAFFQEILDPLLKYAVFHVLMTDGY